MHEKYFPPDDGFPRLKYKSLEILWCLSQGWTAREIQSKIGPLPSGYCGKVRSRYKKRGITATLETFQQISEIWPT